MGSRGGGQVSQPFSPLINPNLSAFFFLSKMAMFQENSYIIFNPAEMGSEVQVHVPLKTKRSVLTNPFHKSFL